GDAKWPDRNQLGWQSPTVTSHAAVAHSALISKCWIECCVDSVFPRFPNVLQAFGSSSQMRFHSFTRSDCSWTAAGRTGEEGKESMSKCKQIEFKSYREANRCKEARTRWRIGGPHSPYGWQGVAAVCMTGIR